MIRLLVVGQTPPPWHGQAIMIENLVSREYDQVEITHIRMDFSQTIEQVGKFSVRKLLELFKLIGQIMQIGIRRKAEYLYYPPSGPNRIPVYRDIAILLCTRWLFRRVIFHFHAAGLSSLYPELSPIGKFLFRKAYFCPDLSIVLSRFEPRDDIFLNSRKSMEIPLGIPDHGRDIIERKNPVPHILYLSGLFRSKGILDLIIAAALLRRSQQQFVVDVVGSFESTEFRDEVLSLVHKEGLGDTVIFHGVKSGDQKWEHFKKGDIFCLPSYYESESFPIVLLEAMQFGIPVVASRWRGIPSIVVDETTGFLTPTKNPVALSDRLSQLLGDEGLRRKMGEAARVRYLAEYTPDKLYRRFESAVVSLEGSDQPTQA